jgi:hypothetical protein
MQRTCPRCRAVFDCGANDARPCACGAVTLDDSTRAMLQSTYAGCLCVECLRALAQTPARRDCGDPSDNTDAMSPTR